VLTRSDDAIIARVLTRVNTFFEIFLKKVFEKWRKALFYAGFLYKNFSVKIRKKHPPHPITTTTAPPTAAPDHPHPLIYLYRQQPTTAPPTAAADLPI